MKKILSIFLFVILITVNMQAITISDALEEKYGPEGIHPEVALLDLGLMGIDSWIGIHLIKERFPNVRNLNLSGNSLKTLPIEINTLPALEALHLTHNEITIEDFESKKALKWLISYKVKLLNLKSNKISVPSLYKDEEVAFALKHIKGEIDLRYQSSPPSGCKCSIQ